VYEDDAATDERQTIPVDREAVKKRKIEDQLWVQSVRRRHSNNLEAKHNAESEGSEKGKGRGGGSGSGQNRESETLAGTKNGKQNHGGQDHGREEHGRRKQLDRNKYAGKAKFGGQKTRLG
jgi:hypothetical protein